MDLLNKYGGRMSAAQQTPKIIDFTDLQNEVITFWRENPIEFGAYIDSLGSVTEKGEDVLSDPLQCVDQLGFKSLSSYVAQRRAEAGVVFGYTLISKLRTKFFFQANGKDLEFYVDRDPKTSLATLWIRPGYTSGGLELCRALLEELERAQLVK